MNNELTYKAFCEQLATHGNKTALLDAATKQSYTYEQLVILAYKLTAIYKQLGVNKGDRVLVFGVGGTQWVPLFLAAQLSGIIFVPIDTRASTELINSMVKLTKPVLVICDVAAVSFSKKIPVSTSAAFLQAANNKKRVPKVTELDPSVVGQILLTSGTWSHPKGVTLQQQNVLHNLVATQKVYKIKKTEVLLSILPLSHAYEQMCGMHIPLFAGCTVVYQSHITGDAIKAAIKEHDITMIIAVPRILELFKRGILAKIPAAKRPKVFILNKAVRYTPVFIRRMVFSKVHDGLGPTLRTLVVGGAPLTPHTDTFFQGLGYTTILGYGLSETAPILSIYKKQYGRRAGGVGKLLQTIEHDISTEGELLVRGPSVFSGYWPKTRSPQEWFNTGDLATVKASRHVILHGRSKNMLVFSSGDKVMLEEIESLVDALEGIEESICLSKNNSLSVSEGLHIVYRAEYGNKEAAIKKALLGVLPASAYIISVKNIFPDSLHRTHTMKLSRKTNHDTFITS